MNFIFNFKFSTPILFLLSLSLTSLVTCADKPASPNKKKNDGRIFLTEATKVNFSKVAALIPDHKTKITNATLAEVELPDLARSVSDKEISAEKFFAAFASDEAKEKLVVTLNNTSPNLRNLSTFYNDLVNYKDECNVAIAKDKVDEFYKGLEALVFSADDVKFLALQKMNIELKSVMEKEFGKNKMFVFKNVPVNSALSAQQNILNFIKTKISEGDPKDESLKALSKALEEFAKDKKQEKLDAIKESVAKFCRNAGLDVVGGSNIILILGLIIGGVVLVALCFGGFVYMKRKEDKM